MCCYCGCRPWEDRKHGMEWLGRRFLTKEEKIERLESYAEELKKELSAVQEQIKELKS